MAINKKPTTSAAKQEDAEEVIDDETEESNEGEEPGEDADADDDSDAGSSTDVDYSELFKNEEERSKAQRAIANAKYGERKAKREAPAPEDEPEEDEDDDKPLTRKDIQKIQQDTEKRLQEREAYAIARQLTGSDEGARAVALYWKNRVVPTGDLQADVEFAYGGLHHKKLMATNSELARSLANKGGTGRGPSSPQGDGDAAPAPKLKSDMVAVMKQSGYVYGKDKQWRKKLPNGNSLILDPKTRKTTLVKKSPK